MKALLQNHIAISGIRTFEELRWLLRGNPDFKQDAIVQNFAQLEGKKTIEIAAQQSGLVE